MPESDRNECVYIVKVIGYNGGAFYPRDGTFWVVAQLLKGAMSMTVCE